MPRGRDPSLVRLTLHCPSYNHELQWSPWPGSPEAERNRSAGSIVAQLYCCSHSSCSCSSHCSPPALVPQVKGPPGYLCLGQEPVPGLPCTFPQPQELLPGLSPVPWTLPSSEPATALGMWTDHPPAPFVWWLSGNESLTPSPLGMGSVTPAPLACLGYPSHGTSAGSGHFTALANVKLGMV